MVFSTSSGNAATSRSPSRFNMGAVCAFATQSGCLSDRIQLRKEKAMTTISSPRAAPKTKPSVLSSRPTRLSTTKSEIRIAT